MRLIFLKFRSFLFTFKAIFYIFPISWGAAVRNAPLRHAYRMVTNIPNHPPEFPSPGRGRPVSYNGKERSHGITAREPARIAIKLHTKTEVK